VLIPPLPLSHGRAGPGRPLALLLTVLLAVLLLRPGDGVLPAQRVALFDRYQILMPRHRTSAPVLIISIDDASIRAFGQWPWPRTRMAELIARVTQARPLAIGIDILLPEPDASSPEALAARLAPEQGALKAQLAALQPYDEVFAASMRRARVVLGVGGFDDTVPGATDGVRVWPLRGDTANALAHVRRYPQALASLPQLQAAAKGQALLTADLEKGIVRRVPMVGAVGESLLPGFALELLRVATGQRAIDIHTDARGVTGVSVGALRVPTLPNGTIWPHFARPSHDHYISALEILSGKEDLSILEDKIIIVALTGAGLLDYKTSVRGDVLPGADVHAQIIESFYDGRFLQRPARMARVEAGVFVLLAMLLVWALPVLRPGRALLLCAGIALSLFGAGGALFWYAALLFDAAAIFFALLPVTLCLLGFLFFAAVSDRKRTEGALQQVREAAARAAGELSAARRIQMNSLPLAATAFPRERRFALDALLEPAREVGGDLYDFYMLDADRLFFLVGDVSGKGLPASLFMAVTKALSKSIALRGPGDVGTIMKDANHELVRENPEMLFVTGLAGILDARTGHLALCNAGHDAPRRIGAGGRVEKLHAAEGPPLCVIDDFDYPVHAYQLAPGECLCLTTDGISEAMNGQGELFGNARLDAALAAGALEPAALVLAVREAVRGFVGSAEPSDDLALLVLRWNGPT